MSKMKNWMMDMEELVEMSIICGAVMKLMFCHMSKPTWPLWMKNL